MENWPMARGGGRPSSDVNQRPQPPPAGNNRPPMYNFNQMAPHPQMRPAPPRPPPPHFQHARTRTPDQDSNYPSNSQTVPPSTPNFGPNNEYSQPSQFTPRSFQMPPPPLPPGYPGSYPRYPPPQMQPTPPTINSLEIMGVKASTVIPEYDEADQQKAEDQTWVLNWLQKKNIHSRPRKQIAPKKAVTVSIVLVNRVNMCNAKVITCSHTVIIHTHFCIQTAFQMFCFHSWLHFMFILF